MSERPSAPPNICPKCKRPNGTDVGTKNAKWVQYTLDPQGPSVGCGNCGHYIQLAERPRE